MGEIKEAEEDLVPNTLFVPLKTGEPEVDRREFLIYIFMLLTFQYNVVTQDFSGDFAAVKGLQDVVDMNRFDRIKTLDDYKGWWGSLRHGLEHWEEATIKAKVDGVNSIDQFSNGTGGATAMVREPCPASVLRVRWLASVLGVS
jgi:hypothetical protein